MQWPNEIASLSARTPIFLARPLDELVEDFETRNSRSTLFLLCEAAESLLRFLAIVASAELIHRNNDVAPEWLAKAAERLLVVPTFGSLREFLSIVAENQRLEADGLKVLEEFSSAWPDLNEALFRKDTDDPSPERQNLIEVRNPLAHGSGINEKYARDLLEIWGPRFAEALNLLPWLIELELWTRDETRGPLRLVGLEPTPAAAPDEFINGIVVGEVVLRRSEANVPLVPMSYRRSPRDGIEPVAQLFVRQGPLGLLYGLFGSADMLQAQGGAEERERFEAMFDLPRIRRATRERQYQERGYDREFEVDARAFVARAQALDELWSAVIERPRGIVGVFGRAGVGKSSLVAKVTVDLRAELTERMRRGTSREMVLAYRFTHGDRGCAPLPFLRWLIERLQDLEEKTRHPKPTATIYDLREQALRQITSLSYDRLVLVLDGLDELARRESRFVRDFVERIAKADKLLVIASSRPEPSIQETMMAAGAFLPWPDGLPGMSPIELRIMLVSLLPRAAKRLVNDDTFTEGVRNAFMDAVVARANDLPLYVALVVQATHDPGFRPNDLSDPGWLPTGVEAFFQHIVDTGALSDRRRAGPLIGCILALARTPMSAAELGALYMRSTARRQRRHAVGDEEATRDRHAILSGDVLADLGGLLRRSEGEDGISRFRLLHDDLRIFVRRSTDLASTLEEAMNLLADSALTPGNDAAANYLFRHGVWHVLEAWPDDPAAGVREAADLLSGFDYQYLRLQTLAPEGGDGGIRDDWARIEELDAITAPDAQAWRQFWATDGGLVDLLEGHSAARRLLALALDYHPSTTIGASVDDAIQKLAISLDGVPVPRNASRVVRPSSCIAELRGHTSAVGGVHVLSNGMILSWGAHDNTLRLWRQDGRPFGDPIEFGRSLEGAKELSDGRLLSWGGHPSEPRPASLVRLWRPGGTLDGELSVAHRVQDILQLSDGNILPLRWGRFAFELLDRRILTWDRNQATLRIKNAGTCRVEAELEGHEGPVVGARELRDGRILSWSKDNTLRLWSADGQPDGNVLKGHRGSINGACEISDGRIMSWSDDGTLRLWWPNGEQAVAPMACGGKLQGALELSDGRLLAWGYKGAINLWRLGDRPERIDFRGHTDGVYRVRELSDGRLLSWSHDGTLRLWLPDGTPDGAQLSGHPLWIKGVCDLSDGRVLSWGEDATPRIWNLEGDQSFESTTTHGRFVLGARFLSDKHMISWGEDQTLRLWRPDGQPIEGSVVIGEPIVAVVELSDGRILARGRDGTLIFWDREAPQEVIKIRGRRGSLNWGGIVELSDGRILSWGNDGYLALWRPDGQRDASPLLAHEGGVSGALQLSDGRIISWGQDGAMRLWSPNGQVDCETLIEPNDKAVSHACELSDERILTWNKDGDLHVWSITYQVRCETIQKNSGETYRTLELANGDIVEWGVDCVMRLRCLDTLGKARPMFGHRSFLDGAIELADGRILSWTPKELLLWQLDGQETWRGSGDIVPKAIVGAISEEVLPVRGRIKQVIESSPRCIKILSGLGGTIQIYDCELSTESCDSSATGRRMRG